MSTTVPSKWLDRPELRALWDHTATHSTEALLDALDQLETAESVTTERLIARQCAIEVLETRHDVDPLSDADLQHLWSYDTDGKPEKTYPEVLRTSIRLRERTQR